MVTAKRLQCISSRFYTVYQKKCHHSSLSGCGKSDGERWNWFSNHDGILQVHRLFRDEAIELDLENLTDAEKVMAILKMEGPKPIKELQMSLNYRSRSQFLNEVINPLMKSGEIYRDGKPKSPTALIKIKK